jgi:hypothetical protein
VKKYVFWGMTQQNHHVAFSEDLSLYARADTFWRAVKGLCERMAEPVASTTSDETEISRRLLMFQETGVNKVEVFVEADGDGFAVRCANSRSRLKVGDEIQALLVYIDRRAETARVNTGGDG